MRFISLKPFGGFVNQATLINIKTKCVKFNTSISQDVLIFLLFISSTKYVCPTTMEVYKL
jgi:hypothetical protein